MSRFSPEILAWFRQTGEQQLFPLLEQAATFGPEGIEAFALLMAQWCGIGAGHLREDEPRRGLISEVQECIGEISEEQIRRLRASNQAIMTLAPEQRQ